MDHNPSGRRPHYRGRRGTERRGNERRATQPVEGSRNSGEQIDVEQILREIRARVSQRHGIELTPQQIQDLAARRLEAILDPRTVNPTLFDQLRRGAAAAEPLPPVSDADVAVEEEALYQRGGPTARFMRWLLGPLLKPLLEALQTQGRINREAAARAAESERRQTEWNALHYQVLQRLVTEVSRSSIEMQSLSGRLESLAARVDFSDRRVRTLEHSSSQGRTPRAATESVHPQAAAPVAASVAGSDVQPSGSPISPATDAPRRRRRRRRGRRGTIMPAEAGQAFPTQADTDLEDDVHDGGSEGDEEPEPPTLADAPPYAPPVDDAARDATVAAEAPPAETASQPEEPAAETVNEPPDPGPQDR